MNDAEQNAPNETEIITPVITENEPVITESIPDFRNESDLPINATVEIRKSFELNGKTYELIDYENEFTLKHYKIAKPFLTELLNLLYSELAKINPDAIKTQIDLTIGLNLINALMNFEHDIELLALLYTEPNQKLYDDLKYKARIREFENITDNLYAELVGAIQNFLFLKIAFTQQNANSYLKAIMPTK